MKVVFFIIIALFSVQAMFAQTNYYKDHSRLKTETSTFVVENKVEGGEKYYIVYNMDNKHRQTPFDAIEIQTWNGQYKEIYEMVARERDNPHIIRAMKEVFTEEEIAAMKATNEKIALAFVHDNKGIISEVSFAFPDDPVFYSIPPEKWLAWEEKIKEYLIFPVPAPFEDNTWYKSQYLYLWEIE